MRKFTVAGLLMTITSFLCAQDINSIINVQEARRIENKLASDEMRGRALYSPELDKAADFIASEFKDAGLQLPPGAKTFRQEFSMISAKQLTLTATLDNATIDPKTVIVITSQPHLKIDQSSGYETAMVKAGSDYRAAVTKWIGYKKNVIVVVDTSFSKRFSRLASARSNMFKAGNNVVFILGTAIPSQFSIDMTNEITEKKLANVVGILPGKSKKNEYVIFSGHYDHIGVEKNANGADSIFNGANDDAAGTTAVILLAKYFKKLNNNERTIVFVAFTGEESGGFGSRYFSNQYDPATVMAMFNIEMIGTESKWGKNSAYITGYERTDMGAILQKNLEGTGFTFYPDPYPTQNLFFRSDNATLAAQGVPAHTISTSKMDSEPNYHRVSDEVSTLDLDNMTMIIKSVALSSRSIVAGKETPTRVKMEESK
jgi:hypothetical protein